MFGPFLSFFLNLITPFITVAFISRSSFPPWPPPTFQRMPSFKTTSELIFDDLQFIRLIRYVVQLSKPMRYACNQAFLTRKAKGCHQRNYCEKAVRLTAWVFMTSLRILLP